ncbi:putative ATP-grasp superfamily ATP-dependent carboligase [Lachnospiraceae bacterium PFB1-21]
MNNRSKEAIKIMIFPAGSEVGLEIYNALKYCKNIEVWGGASVDDHTKFIYEHVTPQLPYVTDASFIYELNKVLENLEIDFLYPANDEVQYILTKAVEKICTRVVTSPLKTIEICRDKLLTYDFFSTENFVPRIFTSKVEDKEFPIFIKPRVGHSSIGARRVESREELERLVDRANYLLAEYLPGDEYTVDCFTGSNGEIAFVQPRVRKRTRIGISVRSKKIALDEEILDIAKTINRRLVFVGAWFFQVRKDSTGDYKLLEISARIPGTMGLSRNQGVNFPLLTIYEILGISLDINCNDYNIEVDRAFISRYQIEHYYNAIYVDFDDTLVIRNRPNALLIAVLYQARTQGKEIYLLTKHCGDIQKTLEKYAIAQELFTEIIQIEQSDKKCRYIKRENAIFIDDSFSERKEIREMHGIPTFDVDMIESLLDWNFF